MNDKEWKQYRRQAEKGEPYDTKTRDVLALLDERDTLRSSLMTMIRYAYALGGRATQFRKGEYEQLMKDIATAEAAVRQKAAG